MNASIQPDQPRFVVNLLNQNGQRLFTAYLLRLQLSFERIKRKNDDPGGTAAETPAEKLSNLKVKCAHFGKTWLLLVLVTDAHVSFHGFVQGEVEGESGAVSQEHA